MKKLLVILLAIGLLAGCGVGAKKALAEINLPDLIEKLPNLNQSIIFSLDENKVDYAASVTLVELLNKKIAIDIGYSPAVEVLGLASLKLVNFKDIITFPILDLITIEPFVYGGLRRIENFKEPGEWDWGVGVKLISINF